MENWIKPVVFTMFFLFIAVIMFSYNVKAKDGMGPSLTKNTLLLVNTFDKKYLKRGDVVVIRYYSNKKPKNLVSRVIAIGGETVAFKDNQLYINGNMAKEDYLPVPPETPDFIETKVPEGSIFVMGDNRKKSIENDMFGIYDMSDVIGKATFVYYPPSKIGFVK